MTAMDPERVLCSRTLSLPASWLPEAGAVPLTEEMLFATLDALAPEWRSRPEAEQDPAFKQWIPYALLRDAEDRLAAYPRRGSETRLHGLWSLGVGGHVNPQDARSPVASAGWADSWRSALVRGLRRELAEEFPSAQPENTRFLGLVHESLSTVGQVHLGAIFVCDLGRDPGEPGPELLGLRWIPTSTLGTAEWPLERFELWSRLALRLLPPASSQLP